MVVKQLRDYDYIDESRLNSYYEQLANPTVYDKVPTWKAGFSMAGPKVEAVQNQVPREPTRSEKIDSLLTYLSDNELLRTERVWKRGGWKNGPEFCLETLNAYKYFVPPRSAPIHLNEPSDLGSETELDVFGPPSGEVKRNPGIGWRKVIFGAAHDFAMQERRKRAEKAVESFKGVTFWYSPNFDVESPGRGQNQLFLIPDNRDDTSGGIPGGSAYSAIVGLQAEFGYLLGATSLHDLIHHYEGEHSKLERQFIESPLESLKRFGAEVVAHKTITSLYRIRRADLTKEEDGVASFVTFGYPIFIAS